MPPKTPSELKEQIEEQTKQLAKEGHERTAEGMSVETPTKDAFFNNLEVASKPRRKDDKK